VLFLLKPFLPIFVLTLVNAIEVCYDFHTCGFDTTVVISVIYCKLNYIFLHISHLVCLLMFLIIEETVHVMS
jgi:hypothetical protein